MTFIFNLLFAFILENRKCKIQNKVIKKKNYMYLKYQPLDGSKRNKRVHTSPHGAN